MIGFSFSIVTCWSALSGSFTVGIVSGGPPVMVWSWAAVSVLALAVALSFAEFCAQYPVAGGQYSWVAALAPKRWARGMSWVTGWFMIVGLVAVAAVNNFFGANFVLGLVNLCNPDYVIKRWHTVLVTYCIILVFGAINIFVPRILNGLSKAVLVWNIVTFLVIIITMLATRKDKQSASFVFGDFRNDTGLSPALGVIAGLLQSFFGMCCYDAPAHMTEEMENPSRDAPIAIVASVILGGVTGFVFLVSAFFCIGDIDAVASSSTGVPLIQILYDSTGSVAGTCVLSTGVIVVLLFSANGLMAEGSRAVYAFARDHGLPFSHRLSAVHPRLQVPVAAIILCMVVQAAFNTIYIGTYTGFNTVISIATEGFYISYAMPIVARLMSHFSGEKALMHPKFNLGRWSIPLNIISAVFLIFAAVTFNFPSAGPVNAENGNYCSAAVGLVILLSALTWFLDGHKHFTMPHVTDCITGVDELKGEEIEPKSLKESLNESDGGKGEKTTVHPI
jgi:choline transport protein